ncbi:MAG: sigma-70 family RNA polymerase sigma factor [Myxococcales bacterium]|nr:MAG: sigma-70 family RNA polymerase sigma factor [Myxococcales bacterium]
MRLAIHSSPVASNTRLLAMESQTITGRIAGAAARTLEPRRQAAASCPAVTPPDRRALEALVTGQLDLVAIIARQLARELGVAARLLEDLESAGREGLMSAAQRFDPERGVPFRRFANYRVRGAMIDALRRESDLPRRVRRQLQGLEAAQSLNEAGAEQPVPTTAESADAALATGLVCAPAFDDGEPVAVDQAEAVDERLAREQLRGLVQQAVADLPEQERALVQGHYFEGRRFDEVSAELGLSKSWGSRLHSRAVARLTERLRGTGEG